MSREAHVRICERLGHAVPRSTRLIVEPAEDALNVSTLMKRINGRQAAYVNKLEGRSGSLWEGRYKASPVDQDAYLLACIRYIELNPIRAKMVARLEDYPWSSFSERRSEKGRGLLDLHALYLALGKSKTIRWRRYMSFLEEVVGKEEQELIREAVQRNQLTGNARFVDEIEQRVGLRIEMRGRGRPRSEK